MSLLMNRHMQIAVIHFSKYALYIASIYQTIPKFSINSFIYISGMLTKFGYGFQLRKNSVNDGIDTFKSTYENNI